MCVCGYVIALSLMQRDLGKHEKLDRIICVEGEIQSMCF
jgi:hypothetical protein